MTLNQALLPGGRWAESLRLLDEMRAEGLFTIIIIIIIIIIILVAVVVVVVAFLQIKLLRPVHLLVVVAFLQIKGLVQIRESLWDFLFRGLLFRGTLFRGLLFRSKLSMIIT